jgi:hypothetical protein
VWTTAAGDSRDANVMLRGWNYAKEVLAKGRNVQTICENVWLEKDEDMHDMTELLQILQ